MIEKRIEKEPPKFSLKDLTKAASAEQWDEVDINLPDLCNEPETINWALNEGINHEHDNLRDLAVSILEKSTHELSENETKKLKEILESDKNPYVQFRAAFALFNRDDRSSEVIGKLKEALRDKDVKKIAEKYLQELESER